MQTNEEVSHAVSKLAKKNFNIVILNSMKDANACFGYDTNKINIIKKDGVQKQFRLKPKKEVAEDIVVEISDIRSKTTLSFVERNVYEYENMFR